MTTKREEERRRGEKTHLEVLRNLANKTLEGEFPNEELRRLLVPTDLTESDRSGAETMGLLDTAGGSLHAACRVRCDEERRGKERRRTTEAVLRAPDPEDLAASCLRGALPIHNNNNNQHQPR